MVYNEKTPDRTCLYELSKDFVKIKGVNCKTVKSGKYAVEKDFSFSDEIPLKEINPKGQIHIVRNHFFAQRLFLGVFPLILSIIFCFSKDNKPYISLAFFLLFVFCLFWAFVLTKKIIYIRFCDRSGIPVLDIAKSNNEFEAFVKELVLNVKKCN